MRHARLVSTGPSRIVLAAFGIDARAERLPGGNGETWRAEDVVFKPIRDEREAEWLSEFSAQLPQHGFRVALPVRSRDGSWVVDGWTASTWLPGEHRPDRLSELLAAGDAFHAAARSSALPAFISEGGRELRDPLDRWRYADRVAWGEVPANDLRQRPEIRALLDACRPGDAPDQLVHCDLVGNVLFTDGMPPGIIDLSLYWRPLGYSAAIAFADAVTWEGVTLEMVRLLERYQAWRQLFVRGVLFRVVVNELARRFKPDLDAREPFEPIIRLALAANASQ